MRVTSLTTITLRHRPQRPHSRIGGSSRLTNLHRQHGNNLPLNGDTVLWSGLL